ncbi:MAG: hypothetical protein AB1941_29640 [Gemmatimonadota bacterium]
MKLPPLARSVLVALALSLPLAAYAGWTRALRERGFRVAAERMPLPYRGGVLEKECPDCTEQIRGRCEQSLVQGFHAVGVLVGVRDGRVAYVQGALVRQGVLL